MKYGLLAIIAMACWGCGGSNPSGRMRVYEDKQVVSIENSRVVIHYDLSTGYYSGWDKQKQVLCLDSAFAKVNELVSTQADQRKWESSETDSTMSLRIAHHFDHKPSLLLWFTVSKNSPDVLLSVGVDNQTTDTVIVKTMEPIAGANVFPGKDITRNLKVLDGNGGGEATMMREKPALLCRNNLMMHFGEEQDAHTLVMGGITYGEFEKFAQIGSAYTRKEELRDQEFNEMKMLTYMDLGQETETKQINREPEIRQIKGGKYVFKDTDTYSEACSVVWAQDEIELDVSRLEKDKIYSVGLVWCDDGNGRMQSIWIQDGDNRKSHVEVIKKQLLPDLSKGESPVTAYFRIPKEFSEKGNARIIVKKEKGVNAVASELVIYEGRVYTGFWGKTVPVKTMSQEKSLPQLRLYGQDAVGKRVDPGTVYLPERDHFYLDFITTDPFIALENYGVALAKHQQIVPRYYYFPSICLWYAMEPRYGGIGTISTNDSPGAVAEMERVNKSGWLKYTTMAIRLVPDCYEDNNENGWWDDEHWQMHGSGKQHPGMKLQGGHYRSPYETTEKWAQAVTNLGGIPLTYFQTAVRSKDYAEQYPEHMLYNESYHETGDWDYFNKGYSTYDFTDTGFSNHMREVYSNLKNGGVRGLMYDYAYTGWADSGGMDDKYATAGSHYRHIYELAKEGLGDDCYLHERNLARGSDITLGIVASQRIWGDTDIVTPEMVTRGGLRWYKNRVAVAYDMDAKNLIKVSPDNPDGLRKMLTMCYVASSRLLLANSFCMLDSNHIYTLSRVFPFHQQPVTARPVDMLIHKYPKIYDFRIHDDWHQLVFYNQNDSLPETMTAHLAGSNLAGGLGLIPQENFHIYDFWNDTYLGLFSGNDVLSQELRPGEARMMSVRKAVNYPQVLSTDRHLMQGLIELSDVNWSKPDKKLSGKAQLIGGESLKIAIACNGWSVVSANAENATSQFQIKDNLVILELFSDTNQTVNWQLFFNN